MTKASGPIKYMEHQTPMTDETGKHLVHPQFVNNGIHDFAAMTRSVAEHRLLGSPQFIAAIDALEQDTLMALAMGKEVRIGNMFIVKPKLSVRHHTDADGTPYRNVYHEGDRIPPTDVSLTGIEVRPHQSILQQISPPALPWLQPCRPSPQQTDRRYTARIFSRRRNLPRERLRDGERSQPPPKHFRLYGAQVAKHLVPGRITIHDLY